MSPQEELHAHHQKLIGTIKELAERAERDPAEASLLLSFCNEYLVSHAEAEETTLYAAHDDPEFINNLIVEHKEIKHSLDDIDISFSKGESEVVRVEVEKFVRNLIKHFAEEENTLIPEISVKLSEEELESLIGEAHRIETSRKKADLWSLFEYDHRRIDLNIAGLRNTFQDKEKATANYVRVRAQLLKHIELEETVLFAAFARHASQEQMGPVHVMTGEHKEITSLISASGDSVTSEQLRKNTVELTGKLAVHNKKEELILYPLINRTIPIEERAEIFRECYEGLASV